MRVFITGATGFVGSHLTRALLQRGDEVICLVRDTEKAARLFPEKTPTLITGSLSDAGAIKSASEGADVVFHSAGATTARNREGFFAVNAQGTTRVVEAVAESAPELVRFVYISSQAAAGPSKKGTARIEENPPAPVSNYGASKLGGEARVRAGSLPWTIIRPCAVYGPGDAAFLSVFKVMRLGFMPMLGSPDQELSMIHVRDLVTALLGATEPGMESQTYFAAHPEVVTTREFCKHISSAVAPKRRRDPLVFGLPKPVSKALLEITHAAAGLVGKSTFLCPDKGNEYFAEAWVCSPKKLEEATGWTAEVAVREGVPTTAKWYSENGWL